MEIVPRTQYARLLLPVLLLGTIVLLYGPLTSFPYAVDDWGMLRSITFTPTGQFLLDAFNPAGKLFFRPFPCAYFAALYAVGGLCPFAFHVISLFVLAVASFLVVDIGRRLSGNEVAGWGAGFLFATASSIHMDTQLWLVGAYEIGALLFALLSVSAALRGRYTASAVSLTAALGCKEVAVTLPCFLIILSFAVDGRRGEERSPRGLWSRFRWHVVVLAVYVFAKSTGILLFTLPASHPYAHRATFANILDSARLYAYWSLEALVPIKAVHPAVHWMLIIGGLLILVSALGVALAVLRARIHGAMSRELRVLLALASWVALVVVLPVLLGSILNKYYLLSAVPALALGTVTVLQRLIPRLRERVLFPALVLLLIVTNLIDGSMLISRKIRLGLRDGIHATSWGGDNHLIRKAGLVRMVWKPVLALAPSVPPHTVFVFSGIETGVFQDAAGPQTWYRDSTLRVAETIPGTPVIDGKFSLLFPRDDPANAKEERKVVAVDRERILSFRLAGDSLVRVPRDELLRTREEGAALPPSSARGKDPAP